MLKLVCLNPWVCFAFSKQLLWELKSLQKMAFNDKQLIVYFTACISDVYNILYFTVCISDVYNILNSFSICTLSLVQRSPSHPRASTWSESATTAGACSASWTKSTAITLSSWWKALLQWSKPAQPLTRPRSMSKRSRTAPSVIHSNSAPQLLSHFSVCVPVNNTINA